jgi:hypothetical protein
MIVRAYYKDREVLLTVPDSGLIFDGTSFVSVASAKWIALKWFTPVEAATPQHYPIEYPAVETVHNWENYWVCKVIGLESSLPNGGAITDTIEVTDPLNGACLCGITCIGGEVQNINVFNRETT